MDVCECNNLRARVTGECFFDTELRAMTVTFHCEDCGMPYRVDYACSDDSGLTTRLMIRPAPEPEYRLAS